MALSYPNEAVIKEFNEIFTVLTTHKISHKSKHGDKTILIENIQSCKSRQGRNSTLLTLTLLCCAAMAFFVYLELFNIALVLFLTSLGLTIAYFLSNKNVVIISSPETKIIVNVGNMRRNRVLSFINSIEQAKFARLNPTHKVTVSSSDN